MFVLRVSVSKVKCAIVLCNLKGWRSIIIIIILVHFQVCKIRSSQLSKQRRLELSQFQRVSGR